MPVPTIRQLRFPNHSVFTTLVTLPLILNQSSRAKRWFRTRRFEFESSGSEDCSCCGVFPEPEDSRCWSSGSLVAKSFWTRRFENVTRSSVRLVTRDIWHFECIVPTDVVGGSHYTTLLVHVLWGNQSVSSCVDSGIVLSLAMIRCVLMFFSSGLFGVVLGYVIGVWRWQRCRNTTFSLIRVGSLCLL